jgi:hypothetical protein
MAEFLSIAGIPVPFTSEINGNGKIIFLCELRGSSESARGR